MNPAVAVVHDLLLALEGRFGWDCSDYSMPRLVSRQSHRFLALPLAYVFLGQTHYTLLDHDDYDLPQPLHVLVAP